MEQEAINPDMRHMANGADNYYEYWVNSHNESFFDMGTFIRLGSEIENALKVYYMHEKGYNNLLDLKNNVSDKGVFQRMMPWSSNTVMDLYMKELNIDLNANPELGNIQIIMRCRHLYTHNSGLISDDFISHFKTLTSIDLKQDSAIGSYPQDDVFYFYPLSQLNKYIETVRRFVRAFPD